MFQIVTLEKDLVKENIMNVHKRKKLAKIAEMQQKKVVVTEIKKEETNKTIIEVKEEVKEEKVIAEPVTEPVVSTILKKKKVVNEPV